MNTLELSTCFVTREVGACRDFYERHFAARVVFDCGWYLDLRLGGDGPAIQFMEPRDGMQAFTGSGIMLNFKVADVDAEYARLMAEGLTAAMPLEDHPWGDRGFSVIDPIGNMLYVYSDREPSEDFKPFFKGELVR